MVVAGICGYRLRRDVVFQWDQSSERAAIMVDFPQAESRLLKDPTIQFRFPSAEPLPATSPPHHGVAHGWWEWPKLGTWLFWIVAAIAVMLLVAVIVQVVRTRRLPARIKVASDMAWPVPSDAAPAAVMADADALAAHGDYASAVHTLLLRGVGAIQRGFPRTLAPSHTSRDIAALPTLPTRVRDAFAVIAARAEYAVFGQHPLGQADWDVCRATYAGLLDAAGGKGLP
jgi:hypothetical protein